MSAGPRGGILATRLRAVPWALRTVAREVAARAKGEPPVREAALRWAQAHATPGDPASVLEALDRFAVEKRFLMNVGDEKGPLLDRLVRGIGPGARILELGTFVGYSAVLMSRHLGAAGHLVSIDVDPESARVGRAMAELAGTADRCEFLAGKSADVIARLHGPFDLVFLDHWKGLYEPDMRSILDRGLLVPGGTVVADNVGPMFGDNPYVAWIRARSDFESEYVPAHLEYETIEDGVLVSRHLGRRA